MHYWMLQPFAFRISDSRIDFMQYETIPEAQQNSTSPHGSVDYSVSNTQTIG